MSVLNICRLTDSHILWRLKRGQGYGWIPVVPLVYDYGVSLSVKALQARSASLAARNLWKGHRFRYPRYNSGSSFLSKNHWWVKKSIFTQSNKGFSWILNHSIVDTHILVILDKECHNSLMEYGIKFTLQLFEEIVISQQAKGEFQNKLFNNIQCPVSIRTAIISTQQLS
jgi:hypothetical protein